MKTTSSHKGSALLIVLGMLTFMVISAVAFAAYMRTARLPSSYLRRTVSSRLLAKAALAEAMERLDYAINDNPYPGVGVQRLAGTAKLNRETAMGLSADEINAAHNYFYHHVFIGTNGWLNAEDTVSTLTLEGLAYIPAPLVNAARYYSRQTPTATWHWLGFDAGRYAYSVIDVSDCLDVNRIMADTRRNSGPSRISLAYLFENTDHTGYRAQPDTWDKFMDSYLKTGRTEDSLLSDPGMVDPSKVPLVSVADLNLALGSSSGNLPKPFYNYLTTGRDAFCTTSDKADYLNLMMVTDSYFPSLSTNSSDVIDIATPDGQPFGDFPANASIIKVMQLAEADEVAQTYSAKLRRFGMINLFDYLDEDNIPVSLGLPSVERVPMICSMSPGVVVQANPKAQQISRNEVDGAYVVEYEIGYYLQFNSAVLAGTPLQVGLAYPFNRADGAAQSFTVDGLACMFFTDKTVNLRGLVKAHPENANAFTGGATYSDGIFRIPLQSQSAPSFASVKRETDAVKQVSLSLSSASSLSQVLDTNPAFTVKYRVKVDPDTGSEIASTKEYLSAHCNIVPVDASGNVQAAYANDASFLNLLKSGNSPVFTLNFAFYVRVKENGKTVDMVPATALDDALNGISGVPDALSQTYTGGAGPAMKFTTGFQIAYKEDGFAVSGATPQTCEPKGVYCPDPRYNHAPENWISHTSSVDPQYWISAVQGLLGQGGRANDIWLACSNQGYLQSIYELAMLPRISDLKGQGDAVMGNLPTPSGGTDYATGLGGLVHGNFMWKTYNCFPTSGVSRDDFEGIGAANLGNACKVNPYAQSVDSLMAAFANPPYSWAVASTNNMDLSAGDLKATSFNKKYAFSAMNSQARFDWEDLKHVAEEFQKQVKSTGNWEDAWDQLDWDGDDLFGNSAEDLSDVDRKFLYGFWRDSFANKQQLFLIFLRAEPMMMGGGAIGQTPPQLGARAVALVWRDPEVGEAGNPHRMRVLFYRQFD